MADNEDPAESAVRLEAALERIARHTQPTAAPRASSGAESARLATRLDALIAQLRAALAAATGP